MPVVGGQLQQEGRKFSGEIVAVELDGPRKWVEVEMAPAYPVTDLTSLRRRVALTESGTFELQDTFHFDQPGEKVEEAFITWMDVETSANTAVLRGKQRSLRLTIASPANACFQVEVLEKASQENHKPGVLKRLTIQLPPSPETQVVVQAEILE